MKAVYSVPFLLASVVADFVVPAPESGIGEPVNVRTSEDPIEWYDGEHTVVEHPLYKNTTQSVYYSHPVALITGGAIFTTPVVTTMPMPDPGVQFAIIKMQYDMVDENKRSVPLSELYVHHWLVYDTPTMGTGYNIGCGGEGTFISNVYGAGAEVRGEHYAYPDGYGYVSGVAGRPYWSANLHFIRTEDLSTEYFGGSLGAATKACIECEYAPNRASGCKPGLDGSGVLKCCEQGSRCPVNNPSDKSKKKYMLQSTLTWTTDVKKIKGVRMAVLDGYHCKIWANLKPNYKNPSKGTTCDAKTCTTTVSQPAPFGGTIVWGYDHQHLGAAHAVFSVNGVQKCQSFPHTGTDPHDVPGNSEGYIVGFQNCIDPANYPASSIFINKGDTLTLTAYYNVDPKDNTSYPLPGGEHTGTMHLFYMFIHESETDSFACKDDVCTHVKGGGLPLKTCEAACGGKADLIV